MKSWQFIFHLLMAGVFSGVITKSALAYELFNPQSFGLGRSVILSEPTASTLVNVPAFLARGIWKFESGYLRTYELSELDQLILSAGYRVNNITFGLGLSQFGKSDLYSERIIRGLMGYNHERWVFSATLSAMMVEIGNDKGSFRTATFGLGAAYRNRVSMLYLALETDNLTSPKLYDGAQKTEPTGSLYAQFNAAKSFSFTGRLRVEKFQSPRFSLGQRIQIADEAAVHWGFISKPFEYGAGFDLGLGGIRFGYATAIHPVLGFSHAISLGYGQRTKQTEDWE
ncbi:MAG: hypothetical protein SGI97_11300 [candidate division Zixibacteria bacterium]|nr:hypothetical protein [candidate division Zixibacteria bacterium]